MPWIPPLDIPPTPPPPRRPQILQPLPEGRGYSPAPGSIVTMPPGCKVEVWRDYQEAEKEAEKIAARVAAQNWGIISTPRAVPPSCWRRLVNWFCRRSGEQLVADYYKTDADGYLRTGRDSKL